VDLDSGLDEAVDDGRMQVLAGNEGCRRESSVTSVAGTFAARSNGLPQDHLGQKAEPLRERVGLGEAHQPDPLIAEQRVQLRLGAGRHEEGGVHPPLSNPWTDSSRHGEKLGPSATPLACSS